MDFNSFLVTTCLTDSRSERVFSDANLSLLTKNANPDYLKIHQKDTGKFKVFFGERKSNDFDGFDHPINGTSIVYSGTKLELKSDLGGTETAFYRATGKKIAISNRLENLIEPGDQPDWVAIQTYLNFGYTLSETTFVKGIKQTLPWQNIRFDLEKIKAEAHQRKLPQENAANKTEDDYTREIIKTYGEVVSEYSPMNLMMSAGWDSRTLLASSHDKITYAYTHGDLSSRETNLAKKLSGVTRTNHLFSDVRHMTINNKLLDEMIEKQGHCLWPIWYIACQAVISQNNLPIVSGAIGARLGGHCGPLSVGSRSRRMFNSINLVAPRLMPEKTIVDYIKARTKISCTPWYLSDSGKSILDSTTSQTDAKLQETLDYYLEHSPDSHHAIEHFNFDHQNRQYFAKQPQTARTFSGYYSPLSHEKLLSVVYTTPLKHRFHNAMNRKIIASSNPGLLEFPMAATLVKARRSLFIQECSRALRLLIEKCCSLLNAPQPRLGWFNYDHLFQGDELGEIVRSLESDIWCKERMLKKISEDPKNGIDAGSTLDMLCKIKTVDHYLMRISGR